MMAAQLDMFDNRRRKRVKKPPAASESQEQEALFRWAKLAEKTHPELALLFHVPNGGGRAPWEGRALKRRGVRAGIPDICLPVPRRGYGALYIELKRVGKGKDTSEAQEGVIEALRAAGNHVLVCEGWEKAKDAIEEYLEVPGNAPSTRMLLEVLNENINDALQGED